ncbi:MAG: hypothetical protein WD072_08835 [Pirellulales bacterium]
MFQAVTLFLLLAAAIGATKSSYASEPASALQLRDPELARAPSWTKPTTAEVRERAVAWARAHENAAQQPGSVDDIWSRPGVSDDVVTAAVDTVALVDPRVAALRDMASLPGGPAVPPAWVESAEMAAFPREAVTLWLGRELVRQGRFDEALPLLADLEVETAIDPAGLLFHRGCCQHWLLDRQAAVDSFDRLLERETEIPVRYARLALLLRADIAAVEAESLDHIARRIRDVRRRLDLGHAGPATRRVQDGVIESLDKLIEKAEQQQQQQGASGSAGAGGSGQGGGAGKPMDDSRIAGGRGPGEVKKRNLGEGDGWGNLPPHEREAALQQIGREFPPHYREAIEQYFKRLATGEERSP